MIEIIREQARLEQVRSAWDDLARRWDNPLYTHDWSAAAARAFSDADRPAVAMLWDSNRIRAIAPLAVTKGFTCRHHVLGHGLMEPGALLYEDRASLEELVGRLHAARIPLALARLPAGGPEQQVLRQGVNQHGLSIVAQTGTSLAATLPTGAVELETTMSGKALSKIRRKLRKAQQQGEVAFEAVRPGPADIEHHITELIKLEAAGWKGRNGTAIASLPGYSAFFYDYGRRAAESGSARVFRLLLNGQLVAIRLAVTAGSALFELKIAYDEHHAGFSPGLLLTHETLKAAAAEGLCRHEFLGVSEDWQLLWPCQERHYFSLRHYPHSLRGAAALMHDIGGRIVRQGARSATLQRWRNWRPQTA